MEHFERSHVKNDLSLSEALSDSKGINQVNVPLQESSSVGASVASFFRDFVVKLCLSFKSQSQFPSIVVIIAAAIFLLMQVCTF